MSASQIGLGETSLNARVFVKNINCVRNVYKYDSKEPRMITWVNDSVRHGNIKMTWVSFGNRVMPFLVALHGVHLGFVKRALVGLSTSETRQ